MITSDFALSIALVIGINDYQNGVPPLGTAKQDAEAIARILEQDYRYQTHLITEQQATATHLIQWLETDLPEALKTSSASRVLFYFAGHGIALNGEDGPEGYLIPQDARLGDVSTYLPMSQIHQALINLPCRHFLGILDCCFAGAFRWSSTRKLLAIDRGIIHQERFDRFIRDPAWQVITSAAHDQTASDSFSLTNDRGQTGHHSPFATALIEALQGQADAYPVEPGKPAGDGVITATELYLYLRDRVEVATDARSIRQTPGIYPLNKHDKGEYIFLPPGHPLNLPPAPPLDVSSNPYRGLESFEESHQHLFFGRKVLTEQLTEFVTAHPLTVVLGASGSGKSSLVKAGLIPTLRQQSDWQFLPALRPGESPFKSLNHALSTIALPEITAIRSPVQRLADWFEIYPQTHLLVVVDQLEELITLCQDEQERQQFFSLLTTAVTNHPHQFHLVLTLRSDFEPQFRHTTLESVWQTARFVVPAMTREELRQAIEEPASTRVMYFDPHKLVDQLIDEVANMPGALPLLSFALSELYLHYLQRQETAKQQGETLYRAITQADYDWLGGVTRSLTQRADHEYNALVSQDAAYAQTIQHVMLRMVAVGGELARRRVPESELQYPEPENQRVQTMIRQFLAARLLVTGTDINQQTYFEPAHDALVRGWDKLLAWQKEQEETLSLQRRLTAAAVEWERVQSQNNQQPKGILKQTDAALNLLDRGLFTIENLGNQISAHTKHLLPPAQPRPVTTRNRPAQFLWQANPYLDVLNQSLHQSKHSFNRIESEFLQQSVLQRRRNVSWRWRIAIGVILGLSGLSIAALMGQRQALISQVEASIDAADANFRSGQALNATLDSLRAAHSLRQPLLQLFQPNSELTQIVAGRLQKAIYSLQEHNRLTEHQGITRSAASPDGKWIVSVGEEGGIARWNWRGQRQANWYPTQDRILNLTFSPNSQQIATAGSDGTVVLWDLQGNQLAQWEAHPGNMVKGLSFSPDGQKLATSGTDKTVRLWQVSGESLGTFLGHEKDVWSVAFSPDGQTIASAADDDTFRIWNLQGKQLQKVVAQQAELHTIAFSPDGQRLVTAGKNGNLRLWNLQGQLLANLPGHQDRVWRVEFSPDGQSIASAAGDGTVRLWSGVSPAASQDALTILRGHQGPARHVSFSADGKHLVSSGDDATVRFWDLQGQQLVTLTGNQGGMHTVQFSPNHPWLITAGKDAQIRQWDLQGTLLQTFNADSAPILTIALHPQNNAIATAQGKTIYLWTDPQQSPIALQGHQQLVRTIQFSPTGNQIASAGDDGNVRLWDLQGKLLQQWPAETAADKLQVRQVAFSPDGQQLASVGAAGVVRLWNLQGQPIKSFAGHLGSVSSVSFSPNGQQLASGGTDGTIRLWRLQNDRPSQLFQIYQADVQSVSFSPDGKRLISGDDQGNVQLWNLAMYEQAAAWAAHSSAIVSQVSVSPAGNLIATAAKDGTAKLWRLENFEQLYARNCALVADYLRYLQQQPEQQKHTDRYICDHVQ
jgi:WD40 repeat protein